MRRINNHIRHIFVISYIIERTELFQYYQSHNHLTYLDTAVMDMVITNLQQQRMITEQLRREAAIKRIMVSKAIEDIMKYITEHEQEDCLLVGFSSQKSNPFREKSSCSIL
ncbi:guanine nucleotide-binding protein subunit gamma-1 [Vespula squamosa]|uniref:Guanine nucleotide-binding protein subunit gamma-1 n=1 Tax=Vespula squamosa TaxID=30214 RepID=A0ABD2C1F3_VESSQ